MPIVQQLVREVLNGTRWQERVRASADLVMWFSLGAFVTSTLTYYLETAIAPSHMMDVVGGSMAAAMLAMLKIT